MKLINTWGPVILWMGVIFYFSALSYPFKIVPPGLSVSNDTIGSAGHIFEFAILSILIGRAVNQEIIFSYQSLIKVIIFTIFYGLFDELHQLWVPGRAFQVIDLGLDSIGALVGVILTKLYYSIEN